MENRFSGNSETINTKALSVTYLIVAQRRHMASEILGNTGLGNCTRPLTKPMLTYYLWSFVAFTPQNLQETPRCEFESYTFKFTNTSPRGHWVK